MADSLGATDARLSMSDFLGSSRFIVPGQGSGSLRTEGATGTVPTLAVDGLDLGTTRGTDVRAFVAPVTFLGKIDDRFDEADVWFDLAIVRPFTLAFGNILSTQSKSISVHSSHREIDISLDSIVNNLGTGTALIGVPTLPETIEPHSGFTITLEVTTAGPPTIDGTIDFVFDVSTQKVAVTGERLVVFAFPPESPVIETLEFLTSILEHVDGSEQRIANRKSPRQIFDFQFAVDGNDRRFIENFLYEWQSRVFGVPVWHESTALTVAATAAATTINVDDTALSDFRVGGLAIVFSDRFTFDALEIASLTATTLTFTSPLINSYAAGTLVYPLRIAVATPAVQVSRALVNDERLSVRFRVLDNDVGAFGDVGAFNSLNGKVLLDGPNASAGRMRETLMRRLVEFDNATGKRSVTSPWSRGRRVSVKGFVTHGRQEILDVRKLLHALRGRQISFYLPTFFDEFELTSLLSNGSQLINIVNVGFTLFAKQRTPSRGILRVVQTDGTVLTRNILSSGEISPTQEQLTVDVAWPSDIQIVDISRIEYVELVRADTDSFRIAHANSIGDAALSFPVKSVFE